MAERAIKAGTITKPIIDPYDVNSVANTLNFTIEEMESRCADLSDTGFVTYIKGYPTSGRLKLELPGFLYYLDEINRPKIGF